MRFKALRYPSRADGENRWHAGLVGAPLVPAEDNRRATFRRRPHRPLLPLQPLLRKTEHGVNFFADWTSDDYAGSTMDVYNIKRCALGLRIFQHELVQESKHLRNEFGKKWLPVFDNRPVWGCIIGTFGGRFVILFIIFGPVPNF